MGKEGIMNSRVVLAQIPRGQLVNFSFGNS